MDFGTEQIMKRFVDSLPEGGYAHRRRRLFLRPEVFAYESEIGKSVFEMSNDELLGMLATFEAPNGRRAIDKITSYDSARSAWSQLWDWYSRNVRPIVNVWQDPEMRGKAAFSKINHSDDYRLDFEWLRSQLGKLYLEYHQEYATYIECIAMLFYDGVSKMPEILDIKEDMINFKKGIITFPKRTVNISQRTRQLLTYVHDLKEMPTTRIVFAMEPFRGSYIPFIVRKSNVARFQDADPDYVATKISTLLVANLRDKTGSPINYQAIYALGGYDFLVERFGKERIDQFIYDASKSDLDVDEVSAACEEHGIPSRLFYSFKRRMYQFATPPQGNE